MTIDILQLNPSIPVDTPKGSGLCVGWVWLSEEHHLIWIVIQDETGECWHWENPKIRGTKNITFQRIVDNNELKEEKK